MAQAFMSYASKDAIFADLARMKLKEAGVQVWIDHGALRAGEEWRNAIDEGISSSDVLLVVISPQSCESTYVTYEWAFALGKGIKVIPLLLEDSDIHPRLAVLQYLDFRNHRTGPWEKLIQEITKHTAASKAKDSSAYVRDMTVVQLQDLIGSAVSLATIRDTFNALFNAWDAAPDSEKGKKALADARAILKKLRPDNQLDGRAVFEALDEEIGQAAPGSAQLAKVRAAFSGH